MTQQTAEQALIAFLTALKVPIDAHTLARTAKRVSALYQDELLNGYQTPHSLTHEDLLPTTHTEMVGIYNLEFFSVCPHHLLPYPLTIHIAFIPNQYTVGFSRIAAMIETLCHRLILVEDLVQDITQALTQALTPQGVACFIQSQQSCMVFRTHAYAHSHVCVESWSGCFSNNPTRQSQFFACIQAQSGYKSTHLLDKTTRSI